MTQPIMEITWKGVCVSIEATGEPQSLLLTMKCQNLPEHGEPWTQEYASWFFERLMAYVDVLDFSLVSSGQKQRRRNFFAVGMDRDNSMPFCLVKFPVEAS